jgi:hypothetical protein
MTTRTAADMELDVAVMLVSVDPAHRRVHVYTADDGTALVLELTDGEAHLLEAYWYGETTANENYHRVDD